MQRNLSTWKFILQCLQSDVEVILLYVLESNGSSPGRKGFMMAVNASGEMYGSIGGGIMEHKFVELAKVRMREAQDVNVMQRQVHDKSAGKDHSGMICSGEQTIFLYKIKSADTEAISSIIKTIENYKTGLLELSKSGITFNENTQAKEELTNRDEPHWKYTEVLGLKDHLYIIGGGHCSLALSKLMSSLDFYIHVFDDRENLYTAEINTDAHNKQLVNNYSELNELVQTGEDVYVVIMTFGYRTDDLAIRALFGKSFKYIGCLGSKNKILKLRDTYEKENLDTTWLNQLHSPIGIQIKSQTPEEIAVSIAAEIIQVRNKDK